MGEKSGREIQKDSEMQNISPEKEHEVERWRVTDKGIKGMISTFER